MSHLTNYAHGRYSRTERGARTAGSSNTRRVRTDFGRHQFELPRMTAETLPMPRVDGFNQNGRINGHMFDARGRSEDQPRYVFERRHNACIDTPLVVGVQLSVHS
ncbi:hypothetical protein AB6A40_011118 [Gnathostoma spinigerum]|uniref:Uncharacterized protein n=1 Tax=Gnathostoma spinigerum TaxID=75299 RepID=A0ABD6F2U5_9BILA